MIKKINGIEPRSMKKRTSKKNHIPWIAHVCNYKCYITFLTGCYSCHWKFKQWEKTELGSCCCSRVQRDGKEPGPYFLSCGELHLYSASWGWPLVIGNITH
jgi:hypothetical protein